MAATKASAKLLLGGDGTVRAGGKAASGAHAAEWSAVNRLEVRAWEKLNPQGDVYSPRTGHTVTSTSAHAVGFAAWIRDG